MRYAQIRDMVWKLRVKEHSGKIAIFLKIYFKKGFFFFLSQIFFSFLLCSPMRTRCPASHLHTAPSSHLAGENAPASLHRWSLASLPIAPVNWLTPATVRSGAFSVGCLPPFPPVFGDWIFGNALGPPLSGYLRCHPVKLKAWRIVQILERLHLRIICDPFSVSGYIYFHTYYILRYEIILKLVYIVF